MTAPPLQNNKKKVFAENTFVALVRFVSALVFKQDLFIRKYDCKTRMKQNFSENFLNNFDIDIFCFSQKKISIHSVYISA